MTLKERIEELEAKGYFEWGLNEEDSKELDELILIVERGLPEPTKPKEPQGKAKPQSLMSLKVPPKPPHSTLTTGRG